VNPLHCLANPALVDRWVLFAPITRRGIGARELGTASGELFCLDPASGHIRWQNGLKGLGRGLVTIASDGNQQALVMCEKQQQEEAAAAAVGTSG
jgi:hypothetical protein